MLPRKQKVVCNLDTCTKTGFREITTETEGRRVWFCCEEHRFRKRQIARQKGRKKLTGEKKEERKDLKMVGRKDPNSIPGPTEYEKKLWGWK